MATTSSRTSSIALLDLQSALTQLRTLSPGGVLSVYLDTSPARTAGQAYMLAYRDGVRSIRPRLSAAESQAFEAAAAEVERYLAEEFAPQRHGIAVFASPSSRTFAAVGLPQTPVLDHVTWDPFPEIGPLETMLDDSERVVVVLFDAKHARLFTVFLGAIEEQLTVEDLVPGKQATGGWFALQQTSFERHREDHLRRHAEHTVRELMQLLRTRAFDRLLVGGPDEPLAVLRRELPRPLRTRVAGRLELEMFASNADVLEAALRESECIERQEDRRLADELLDAASSQSVVLGIAGTLDALAEGRVHLLVIADSFAEAGAQCATCSRLVTDGHSCPTCGSPTLPVQNLREPILRQALAQGSNIETVSGEAAGRLAEYAGIGAWTRF